MNDLALDFFLQLFTVCELIEFPAKRMCSVTFFFSLLFITKSHLRAHVLYSDFAADAIQVLGIMLAAIARAFQYMNTIIL